MGQALGTVVCLVCEVVFIDNLTLSEVITDNLRVVIHWFVCVLISGEVVLLSDYTVCRQGDELTPEQVRILVSVFNLVFSFHFDPSCSDCNLSE